MLFVGITSKKKIKNGVGKLSYTILKNISRTPLRNSKEKGLVRWGAGPLWTPYGAPIDGMTRSPGV
jgi:hypothetical protein